MAKRFTIEHAITSPDGLGYCCQWAFFKLYDDTALIAARLGVSDRAVRYKLADFKRGTMCCRGRPSCIITKLPVK